MYVEELIKRLRGMKRSPDFGWAEAVGDLCFEAAETLTRIHDEAIEKAAQKVFFSDDLEDDELTECGKEHKLLAARIRSLKLDVGSESVAHGNHGEHVSESKPLDK